MAIRLAVTAAALLATACTSTVVPARSAAELYAKHCENLGHAPGSDAFRACVDSEDINAALAVQREYDRKLLRRLDCLDPRIACFSPLR